MMFQELIRAVAVQDLVRAVGIARGLAPNFTTSDLERLWVITPLYLREKVMALIVDALSDYPCIVVGSPTLMWVHHSNEVNAKFLVELPRDTDCVWTPVARSKVLKFKGWVSSSTQLPLLWNSITPLVVPRAEFVCAVAIFLVQNPDSLPQTIEIDGSWWAELFSNEPALIDLELAAIEPFPVALELAQAKAAGAHDWQCPPAICALPGEMQAAYVTGQKFRRQILERVEDPSKIPPRPVDPDWNDDDI